MEKTIIDEATERLRELKSICTRAEKDEHSRGAFLDAVRNWRSDRALKAAEPGVWDEGDALIRETLRRVLQPDFLGRQCAK